MLHLLHFIAYITFYREQISGESKERNKFEGNFNKAVLAGLKLVSKCKRTGSVHEEGSGCSCISENDTNVVS